jgi:hypothetical protein
MKGHHRLNLASIHSSRPLPLVLCPPQRFIWQINHIFSKDVRRKKKKKEKSLIPIIISRKNNPLERAYYMLKLFSEAAFSTSATNE